MSVSRQRLPGLDWVLVGAVLGLLALGVLLVWSATSHDPSLTGGDPRAYLGKQLANVVIGLVLMTVVMTTDHRWVRIVAPVVYLAAVVALALVLAAGSTINGSRSWLTFAGLSLQPSELAKLAVVIGMALFVAERSQGGWRQRVGGLDVVGMLLIAGVPAVLILLQPDLGTMLVPRRALLRGSALGPYFAVPHGDMMLAGCFGLLRAYAANVPAAADAILHALNG